MRRAVLICLVPVVLVAGCTSSGAGGSSAPAPATPAPPATTAAASSTIPSSEPASSSSAPTSSAPTSDSAKAVFTAKANRSCRTLVQNLSKTPQPTSPTDFAAIVAFGNAFLRYYPPFVKQLGALLPSSPDEAALRKGWFDIEVQAQPQLIALVKRAVEAAQDRNSELITHLQPILAGLLAGPSTLPTFLKRYGLTDCARI